VIAGAVLFGLLGASTLLSRSVRDLERRGAELAPA